MLIWGLEIVRCKEHNIKKKHRECARKIKEENVKIGI
jgi:hypothetical protein